MTDLVAIEYEDGQVEFTCQCGEEKFKLTGEGFVCVDCEKLYAYEDVIGNNYGE